MNGLTTFTARSSRLDYRPYLGVCANNSDDCDPLYLIGYLISIESEQRNARVYNRTETQKFPGFPNTCKTLN